MQHPGASRILLHRITLSVETARRKEMDEGYTFNFSKAGTKLLGGFKTRRIYTRHNKTAMIFWHFWARSGYDLFAKPSQTVETIFIIDSCSSVFGLVRFSGSFPVSSALSKCPQSNPRAEWRKRCYIRRRRCSRTLTDASSPISITSSSRRSFRSTRTATSKGLPCEHPRITAIII
jgi:hypothetical protein